MSSVHELKFLKDKIQELKATGVYRKLPVNTGPCDALIELNGKEVINLSSNNYLGLANNDEVKQAAIAAVNKYGAGSGAVRTIVGNMDIHEELEVVLAEFKREEAVCVFQSGFMCNAGVIQAITEKGDLIVSDQLNHASIIDGCRLSRAEVVRFKHASPSDLDAQLSLYDDHNCRKLVITDGVFSMDGDIAPLPQLVEVAEKHGAMVMVDDAHGEGVLGRGGRGIVDHFNLHGRVDVEVGTLSKAFGVVGGFVAGSVELIDYLRQKARPNLFSSAMTVPDIAANLAALEELSVSEERVNRLWENGRYLKKGLKNLGFNIGHSETPITPVIIGEALDAKRFSARLFDEGVFAGAITFPTVPMGTARIRVMVSAAHTQEDLDFALEKFQMVGEEMKIISSRK